MTGPRSTLLITFRHGIWRVWLDGKFFGDYRAKSQAMEAAKAAQSAMATIGRIAEIADKTQSP